MQVFESNHWLFGGLMALAAIAGCTQEQGGSALTGQVKIDGSSTVYPISEEAATQFGHEYPAVKVTVGVSGTGGGFKRFTQGETDISDASRPIKPGEFDECQKNGVAFIEIPVAYDGLSIVVNPKNDFVDQLTVDDLKKIFREDGAAKTWQDVNDQWPAEEITIFAPGTDSGTFDYFKEVVIGDDKAAAIRSDMSVSEDDSVLVTGVAGEENAIGFFGAAYYFGNQAKLKAVKIVNPETGAAVGPSAETIESGEYAPFSRPLFIYVNAKSADELEVDEFVSFYLDNAGAMAQEVQYVSLPQALYDQARGNLDERASGTHFLTAEGEKRSGALSEVYKSENLVAENK